MRKNECLGKCWKGSAKDFNLTLWHKTMHINMCQLMWHALHHGFQYCWLNRKSTLHIVQVLGFYGFGPFGVH
jgi:hypothetical protein